MSTADTARRRLAEINVDGGITICVADTSIQAGDGQTVWLGRVLGVGEPQVGERLRFELDLWIAQPPPWAEWESGSNRVATYLSPPVVSFFTRLVYSDNRYVDSRG